MPVETIPRRSPLTVTPDDYNVHRATAADPDRFDAWIEDVIGRSLGDWPMVVTATLGEGVVLTEENPEDPDHPGRVMVDRERMEVVVQERTYEAPTPPPCWPAGLALRR